MKRLITAMVVAGMCATGAAFAQTPAAKPASGQSAKPAKTKGQEMTYTATCKDGTTYTGKTKKGACAKHGGVKSWEKPAA